jgi:predicted  nucleic acid-binding Zn-ribbon protein
VAATASLTLAALTINGQAQVPVSAASTLTLASVAISAAVTVTTAGPSAATANLYLDGISIASTVHNGQVWIDGASGWKFYQMHKRPEKRRKEEERVRQAVAEAVADAIDLDLADLERAAEAAIAETRLRVKVTERALFQRYLEAERSRQRREVKEKQAVRRRRRNRAIALLMALRED